jgi:MFS family permease
MMKNKQQYEKNLYLNIIYCYLRYTLFFIPIFTPFLLANNISYSQIFFLHFLFGLTVLILEIPFGYLTDRVGRKVGLIIASFLFSSGFFLYGIGSLYWQFVIAEILFGIGYAFYSGTYNAIVYDSLLHLKREKEYKKWEGYMLGAQRGAEIVAAFVTGYIVVHGMHLTFYFSIIPFIVAIPVVLMMKEPKIKKEPIGIGHWHHMGKVVRAAYDHPGVFWFSVYSSVITGTMLGAIWLFQTLWTTYNIPITFFGFLVRRKSGLNCS